MINHLNRNILYFLYLLLLTEITFSHAQVNDTLAHKRATLHPKTFFVQLPYYYDPIQPEKRFKVKRISDHPNVIELVADTLDTLVIRNCIITTKFNLVLKDDNALLDDGKYRFRVAIIDVMDSTSVLKVMNQMRKCLKSSLYFLDCKNSNSLADEIFIDFYHKLIFRSFVENGLIDILSFEDW